MEEVKSLGYKDTPPYKKLRSILQNGLKSIQAKDDGQLEFTPVSRVTTPPAKVSTHTHTHIHPFWDFQKSVHNQLDSHLHFKSVPWSRIKLILIQFLFSTVFKKFLCRCHCSVLFVSVPRLLFVHMEDTTRDQRFQPKGCRVSALVIVCNYPANLFTSAGAAWPSLGIKMQQ